MLRQECGEGTDDITMMIGFRNWRKRSPGDGNMPRVIVNNSETCLVMFARYLYPSASNISCPADFYLYLEWENRRYCTDGVRGIF